MCEKFDVIIVGAGIAGMTAAIYLGRANKSVLILENKISGGQIVNSLKVENWPGESEISGADLSKKIYHQMNNLGVKIEYENVNSISKQIVDGIKSEFLVKTDENIYSSSEIILAVGTEPRKMSEKQEKDAGKRPISYCATCDGPLYKGKNVVVVGSGNTAKHEINYLSGIASKVYHIHHDDPIPKDADAVFVAIGRVPSTDFLKGFVELDTEGYIVAGEDCRTSVDGVYAVGDCRTKSVRQLVTAAADGAVAAGQAIQNLK